jgi:hypothetical protein
VGSVQGTPAGLASLAQKSQGATIERRQAEVQNFFRFENCASVARYTHAGIIVGRLCSRFTVDSHRVTGNARRLPNHRFFEKAPPPCMANRVE